MANFVDERIDLFLACLFEHLRINQEFVLSRVGEEGTRQDTTSRVAIVGRLHDDLEIPVTKPGDGVEENSDRCASLAPGLNTCPQAGHPNRW